MRHIGLINRAFVCRTVVTKQTQKTFRKQTSRNLENVTEPTENILGLVSIEPDSKGSTALTTNVFRSYKYVSKLLPSQSFSKHSEYQKHYTYLLTFAVPTWFKIFKIRI